MPRRRSKWETFGRIAGGAGQAMLQYWLAQQERKQERELLKMRLENDPRLLMMREQLGMVQDILGRDQIEGSPSGEMDDAQTVTFLGDRHQGLAEIQDRAPIMGIGHPRVDNLFLPEDAPVTPTDVLLAEIPEWGFGTTGTHIGLPGAITEEGVFGGDPATPDVDLSGLDVGPFGEQRRQQAVQEIAEQTRDVPAPRGSRRPTAGESPDFKAGTSEIGPEPPMWTGRCQKYFDDKRKADMAGVGEFFETPPGGPCGENEKNPDWQIWMAKQKRAAEAGENVQCETIEQGTSSYKICFKVADLLEGGGQGIRIGDSKREEERIDSEITVRREMSTLSGYVNELERLIPRIWSEGRTPASIMGTCLDITLTDKVGPLQQWLQQTLRQGEGAEQAGLETDTDLAIREWLRLQQGWAGELARLGGEGSSRLSDQDVSRAQAMLPWCSSTYSDALGAVEQLRRGIARKIEAARRGYDDRNVFAPEGGMPTEIPAPEASVGVQDAAVPPDAREISSSGRSAHRPPQNRRRTP
jgi:hypothetical protein